MLFNSAHFLAFFPVAVCLYFVLPHRFRWALLLTASYYFYGSWSVQYLGLLVGTTLIDYVMGRWMDSKPDRADRRRILMICICSNLGVLFFFKYFNFVGSTIRLSGLFDHFPELNVLLPVGISFYTFQSLAYAIEVYRGNIRAERHLGIFAAYVSFFPQLVAGPIERPQALLPQFRAVHEPVWTRIGEGLQLMLWGFVKKVVIADRLASYVNTAYNDVGSHSGATLVLATYCFAFQIFCDFSGYTDIARGAARVMGFELMLNFRQPYLSQSIREFWSRWHISLSSWFRDYLYLPLGGNRVTRWKWYRNLFVTFLISGLWHGANWTFVIWGALHGSYLVIGLVTEPWRKRCAELLTLDRFPRVHAVLRTAITFHLVLFGWLFFRANTLADAWLILQKTLEIPGALVSQRFLQAPFDSAPDLLFLLLILLLASLYHQPFFEQQKKFRDPLFSGALISLQFWTIVTYGVFDNKQFIYFQF